MTLSKHQKIAAAVAGVVLVYLVYRHLSRSPATQPTAAGMAASSNPAANDYASLAGQEQGDVANLQNSIAALGAQEQSDIAGLTGSQGSGGTTFGDQLSAVNDQLTSLGDELGAIMAGFTQPSPPAVAGGQHPVNRHKATKQRKAEQGKQQGKRQATAKRKADRTKSTHVHQSPNRHVAPSVHAPHPTHPAARQSPPAHRPARHPATTGARLSTPSQPRPRPAQRRGP